MINHELREFVDRVMDAKYVSSEDVAYLMGEAFEDLVMTRDTIDVLVALDRAVPSAPVFGDYLVATVVDFVVWQVRPTGHVDRATAHWLLTTLAAGEGPTGTARRIAFEVVREAESCDEALIGFAMARGAEAGRGSAAHRYALAS